MAVLKKSSTGRSLQFITDEGQVYQLSKSLFDLVVADKIRGDFVVLTRMEHGVSASKFPQSPVYRDGKVEAAVSNVGNDVFSKSFKQERKEQKDGAKASEYKVEW